MHVTANRANLLGILVLGGEEGAVGVHLYPLHSLWLVATPVATAYSQYSIYKMHSVTTLVERS